MAPGWVSDATVTRHRHICPGPDLMGLQIRAVHTLANKSNYVGNQSAQKVYINASEVYF